MPKRETVLQPVSKNRLGMKIHTDTVPVDHNPQGAAGINYAIATVVLARTLSPASLNTMNRLPLSSSQDHLTAPKTPNSTIRSVPAESLHLSPDDYDQVQSRKDGSILPPTRSLSPFQASISSPTTNGNSLSPGNGMVRSISAEFGPTRSYSNTPASEESNGLSASPGSAPFNSAIGRASLGKTGRVIDELMTTNNTLKRALLSEQENKKQAEDDVKILKEKMEQLTEDYEKRLHQANVTESLLKKRDRIVEDLKQRIEIEKGRANKAEDREREWKDALVKTEEKCTADVQNALDRAAHVEARNKIMEDHWKERGTEFNKTVEKLRKEIDNLVDERRLDDQKIAMLQSLSDQQAAALDKVVEENMRILELHEGYKMEQEDGLRAIKQRAAAQEAKNEAILEENKKLMGELKWALNVRKNVKDAQ